MKKTIHAIAALSLVLASTSFAFSLADTTILGKDYAKLTRCSDLNKVRDWTSEGKVVNVIVMNDIDCGNAEFKPIGQSESKAFEGVFDGNGKTISKMKILHNAEYSGFGNDDSYAGFFGVIGQQGVVKNITIDNSTVTAESQYAGAVVGLNYGVVENAKTTASVKVNSSKDPDELGGAGGIAGRNGGYGTMTGCENHATVSGAHMAGGIAGANTGAISNSINYGAVSGKTAGGIVGNTHYRTIESNVTHVPGRIAVCQNLGSVTGTTYAGGIVGYNKDGSINNCRNDGSVAAPGTYWVSGIAGGVVGYSYFDNDSRYTSGNYTAQVLNSFSTTNSVTGDVVGGVIGKVENKNTKHNDYSKVENCYYDSQVFKNASAVGSQGSHTAVTTVVGKTTADMNSNDGFVNILNTQNGKIDYTFVWLNEPGDYPVLDFTGCQGNYKITFVVKGHVTLEATTVKGKIAEVTVTDPTVSGATFKGWKDDHGNVLTSKQAQDKFYTRSVTYNAVLNEMFEITFVTDYGVVLDKKFFERGSIPFYYDEENESEIPADLETDSATYKFTGWDKPFTAAVDTATYTAQFEKIAKTFTVTFYVQGATYDEQTVAFNANAQAPANPVVEGFRFDGWDKEFTNVKANLEIHALLTAMTEVCFVTVDTTKCDSVPVDTTIVIPDNPPSSDSLTCDAWLNGEVELHAGDELTIAQLTTLEAKCSVNKLDVKFFVLDNMIDSQSVAYGTAAQAPADPVVEGYRFENWDKDFSYVITALNVNANMTKMTTVCVIALGETKCEDVPADSTMPTPVVPSNEDSTCTEWTVNGETFTDSTFLASEVPELLAKCHANAFDVKFVAFDTVLVDSQRVAFDSSAVAPADPVFEGYRFDGWDKEFTNVQSDLTVNAKMTAVVEYCIVALGETKCDTVPADTSITTPDVPSNEDSTCTEWTAGGETFSDSTFLASEVPELVAKCHANAFDVKFVAFDTVLVDSQRVAFDSSAVAPADPVFEGYRFDGWDKEFTNVQSDLTVNAKMTAVVEVCFVALGETKCDTVPADTTIETPELPSTEDSTCVDWTVGGETFSESTFLASEVSELVAVCLAKEFDVKFVAFDTVLVDSQRVAYGTAAIAPDSLVPVFEGYRFSDWDADFTYVDSNMVVNAVFDTLVKVTISADVGISTLDTSFYVIKDTSFTGLKSMIDSLSGEFFVCEDITVNGEALADTIVATEDLVVSAKCELVLHTVTYYVDDTVYATEKVAHSFSAQGPEAPEKAGKLFSKWDKDLHSVIADIKTKAIFTDVEYDTIKVVVSGKVIDSIVVAKGDSVEYKLPKVKDTKDSTFLGWKVNGKLFDSGDKIIVKFGDKKIVASFDPVTALRGTRAIAGFSIFSENGQLQVIGARIGAELTVLDLQGRVVAKKFVQNSVELISVATRGSYLVRVGTMTKRVVVR
jgi:hypothetical protein